MLGAATGQQVADTIRTLMADPQRLTAMGQRGYQTFQQHYTLTAALAQYDACMRRYFDRDPAYRTVQAPAMSEQRIPETQFAEPVMGKKAG